MNGSDLVEMTLNIGGESFKLNADFKQQDVVREAEAAVRQYFNKLRRNWPDLSDRKILAMTAYQFAFWQIDAIKTQKIALGLAKECSDKITGMLPQDHSDKEQYEDLF